MSVASAVLQYSFFVGPILLLLTGWGVRYLQNPGVGFRLENFFMGNELSLSGLGSLLGAFVSLSDPADLTQVITLLVVMICDIFVLMFVTGFYRQFEHDNSRPKMRAAVLGVVCNLLPLGALIATLYFSKPAAPIPL